MKEFAIEMLHELRDMVARSGRVEEVYGGYEITIKDTEHFPWHRVIHFLLDCSFEVWMEKTEYGLLIMSKPAVD